MLCKQAVFFSLAIQCILPVHGFQPANITIAALSLSVGLGFTQVPQMFHIFPNILRTVFAENCVAVVFLTAIIMNLVMPKEKQQQMKKQRR